MDADVRVIRLIRKAAVEKQETIDNSCYFATDYFDIMQAEQKKLEDPVADILDFGRLDIYEHETAAQSYALYCSSDMLDKYEKPSCAAYRKNPFAEMQDMKYLSIIHVYIAPEIIARMNFTTDDLWRHSIIMEPFADDIYQVLDRFEVDYPDRKFVARVYSMLSAGDFAIVVKSQKPETSYYISSYIRKQEAGLADGSGQTSGYVLYKTYTLLTIKNQVVYSEDGRVGSGNYFVLRGCYSNKYWKEQDQIFAFKSKINERILKLKMHPLKSSNPYC